MAAMLVEKARNLWWERRLGISTRGVVHVDIADSHFCTTMNYSIVWKVLDFLDLTAVDTVVDIGSGKGRFVCCAARYPVNDVVGVDVSADFCELARANAARMRGRKAPIFIEAAWAQEFDYSAATALFLFNPFGPDTLADVLKKIGDDTRGHPVRIAYANPTYAAVFDSQSWLERYELWPKEQTGLEHSVAFYRTRGSSTG